MCIHSPFVVLSQYKMLLTKSIYFFTLRFYGLDTQQKAQDRWSKRKRTNSAGGLPPPQIKILSPSRLLVLNVFAFPNQGPPRTSGLLAPIMLLEGHKAEIFTVKFDPTGHSIASGSFDKKICAYIICHPFHLYSISSTGALCFLLKNTQVARKPFHITNLLIVISSFVECVWRMRKLSCFRRAQECCVGAPLVYWWRVSVDSSQTCLALLSLSLSLSLTHTHAHSCLFILPVTDPIIEIIPD